MPLRGILALILAAVPASALAGFFELQPLGHTTIDPGGSVTFDVIYTSNHGDPDPLAISLHMDWALGETWVPEAVVLSGNNHANPFDIPTFNVTSHEIGGSEAYLPWDLPDASRGISVGQVVLVVNQSGITLDILDGGRTGAIDLDAQLILDTTAPLLASITVTGESPPDPPPIVPAPITHGPEVISPASDPPPSAEGPRSRFTRAPARIRGFPSPVYAATGFDLERGGRFVGAARPSARFSVSAVPEPTPMLAVIAAAALCVLRRRRG